MGDLIQTEPPPPLHPPSSETCIDFHEVCKNSETKTTTVNTHTHLTTCSQRPLLVVGATMNVFLTNQSQLTGVKPALNQTPYDKDDVNAVDFYTKYKLQKYLSLH